MNKLIGRLRAVSVILVPGGVAAAIVMRTLAVYWGRDWLASTVVLAIAGALGLGLLELIARQLRIAQLERELRALPRTPDATTVDLAGPQLSALLRARLDQMPLTSSSDGLAPFLSGLLVMLGLLGTLLGLFQTLHGAGHALTSSADLGALRNSLSAPIAGLTRSFGCAAAGISASAMLGLANALLRRRELRALRVVHAYALGPLRDQSASARQLRAIEVLASQGSALPAAATAIERAGETLSEVSSKLVSLQQSALEAQQRGMRELLADLRRELTKVAGDTGTALQAQVAPLLEQLAARSGEAIEQQSSHLGEVARNLGRELEQDAVRRRAEAAEALHAMRVRLDEAEAARASAHARELATLTSLHAHTLSETEQRESALATRWQDLLERLDLQLEAARTSELERLRSLDEQVAAASERELERLHSLDAQVAAAAEREIERLHSLDAQVAAAAERELDRLRSLDAQVAVARERDHEHASRLASSSAQLHAELEQLSATARERDTEHARRLADANAQLHAELERLANAMSAELTRLSNTQGAELARLSNTQGAELERLSNTQGAELERLSKAMTSELERLSSAVSAELEQRMANERRQAEHVEQALQQLSAAGAAVEHGIASQEGVLERLVERVSPLFEQAAQSSRETAQLALERVDQSAQLLEGTVARQGGAIEGLVERVSALLPELASAAQAGAITTLERLTSLGEEQAARLTQLETSLARERSAHVQALAAELDNHAVGIEQRLARTSGAVEEAAAIWRASTVEMQAVAQLFATSVERQRESAEAWLESLTAVESAVEQAGRDAASDALSEQLASTHELFARQLKFQHELLTQLRTLRSGPGKAREARGGQDVPAGD
jgi:hypothetical protein